MLENPDVYVPRKGLYQICLVEKATDKVLLNTQVVAYSESEAIEKMKIGSIIKELGLNRSGVDFYAKIIGHLYEGATFAEAIAKTSVLTVDEKANIGKTIETKIASLESKVTVLESKVITI